MNDRGSDRSSAILSRGRFAVVHWALVAAGLVAVIVAFTIGGERQRIVTGAIVMVVVIALLIARGLVARSRRRREG